MVKISQELVKQNFIRLKEKLNVKKCGEKESGITLIALVITIVLNCSFLAMV